MFRELLNLIAPLASVPNAERRERIRLRCEITVIFEADISHQATVIDVSSTGICVQLDAKVKTRQKVSIHRQDFGTAVFGRVAWCRPTEGIEEYRVGVMFESSEAMLSSSWLVPALKTLGYRREDDSEKRKLARVKGRIVCTIHCFESDIHFRGAFVDLSVEGALVEGIWPLPIGEEARFKTYSIADLPPLQGKAKVMNHTCLSETPPNWRSGVKFTERNAKLTRQYMKALISGGGA